MDRVRSEGEVNLGVVSITMDGRGMLRNNVEEVGNVERGTPQFRLKSSEVLSPTSIRCLRPDRNDSNHFKAVSTTPKSCCKIFRRMECSMVSEAALRSKSTRSVTALLSILIKMSFWTFNRAVSVEWYLRKPDWNLGEGHFFTVDEKLLKRSLSHYLGNEWKITDWTEIFIDQIKSRFFQ